eukprot:TRINITY_DN11639_c0_g1_i1.p1 TRINITY_DN11639_c0_g1~~TRINITY_DN11639_c0_g1_i1.p1  ORF type:complete len:414 (+),score=36.12 TRINITY_DN11639_c0_g1_i1:45-1244(+)
MGDLLVARTVCLFLTSACGGIAPAAGVAISVAVAVGTGNSRGHERVVNIGKLHLDQANVAIVSVGLARTVAHKVVASSFNMMRNSMLRDGHRVGTFFYVARSGQGRIRHEHVHIIKEELESTLQRLYRPTKVWIVDDVLPCNSACTNIPCTRGLAMPWLQQYFKLRRAWEAVMAWERDNGEHFHWFLRVRPDIVWLKPFQPLALFGIPGNIRDGESVFVPHGGMTEFVRYFRFNDHILLCPRRLCEGYFVDAALSYERCNVAGNRRMPYAYPPAFFHFNRTCNRGYSCYGKAEFLFAVYVIMRDDVLSCMRLIGPAWPARKYFPRCTGVNSQAHERPDQPHWFITEESALMSVGAGRWANWKTDEVALRRHIPGFRRCLRRLPWLIRAHNRSGFLVFHF